MKVNLISDTVTVPNKEMKAFMMNAEVGDDVFGNDPTVNLLEAKIAKMFGLENALYCPTGTMANQIALLVHTNRLDEVICEHSCHIFQYETGGYGFNAGLAINPIKGVKNKLTAQLIQAEIKPDYDWLPNTSLVTIENTCNKGGGTIYTYEEMKEISDLCSKHNLLFHLDGARIFNALTELEIEPSEIGPLFNSISICLSKGLGAPMGTLLLGTNTFIKKARKFRKALGGGMRQIGYMAAAGIYALDHNIKDLKTDHNNTKSLANLLVKLDYVESVIAPQTNIVIFNLKQDIEPTVFIEALSQVGIDVISFGGQKIRMVTHRDLSSEQIEYTLDQLKNLKL